PSPPLPPGTIPPSPVRSNGARARSAVIVAGCSFFETSTAFSFWRTVADGPLFSSGRSTTSRGMLPLTSGAEHLDHFSIECRNVAGAAARDEIAVDNDLLIHPV